MDVTTWLLRLTPPRPLVVSGPGGTETRLAVERSVRERGWRPAQNPAEANILIVTGEGLAPYAERLWEAMPAPRARLTVTVASDVPHQLDSAVNELRDPALPARMVGGEVPMADRAEDRDGLKLDQLHVPLGPALPLWPAGLIVHTRLQGDVIQQAMVEVIDSPAKPFWPTATARRLDSSARLLALTGWPDAAATAQRLRDEALDGAPAGDLLRRWSRRVHRSRTLRWLLTGIGVTPEGAPPSLAGDALTRLHSWLDSATHEGPQETQWIVDNLPTMLAGTELATARLVVASLDPDLDALPHQPDAHHGEARHRETHDTDTHHAETPYDDTHHHGTHAAGTHHGKTHEADTHRHDTHGKAPHDQPHHDGAHRGEATHG